MTNQLTRYQKATDSKNVTLTLSNGHEFTTLVPSYKLVRMTDGEGVLSAEKTFVKRPFFELVQEAEELCGSPIASAQVW